MKRYNPAEIEPKWQKKWEESKVYRADLGSDKPKYLAMSMFNYPSGAGIHIGHAMNYTISDVKARFKRQQGYESYHPVGWDAFGLPAENYAIKAGVSPQESMAKIIPDYHKQYKAMGWSNDWSKEISTHNPSYYKWTQWIFSQMFKQGLAYQDSRMQWWCDKCQTVLANEQVIDGKCWRHDNPDDPIVEQREVKQWFFKITEYADELLEATDDLDWTESVKSAQKNWIGKSVGAEVEFEIVGRAETITVFTTRPDTLYGATFMVLAPEHDLVEKITLDEFSDEMKSYIQLSKKRSEVERQAAKEKTGIFTGSYAINPLTGQKIPIWVADYVLVGYGAGAIMAVPAHDERDYEFAKKFDLQVQQVVAWAEDDSFNPPRKDMEMVERPTVIVHLKDRSTGKFALLNWHGSLKGITTAIMGGIEEGQTPEEAALAEISEEAALDNAKVVSKSHFITISRYCASHKNQNRTAITYGLLAEVDNLDEQGERPPEEQKLHTLIWVNKDKVVDTLTPTHQKYVWSQLWDDEVYTGDGEMINSGSYNGVNSAEARELIVQHLQREGKAKEKVNYRMRDWSISRQRYWGAPIPIIHCEKCGPQLVPDEQLPVVLPELDNFAPSGDGRSALARATDWLKVYCPKCGESAERETDTLDTYIDSSWYMFRYLDSENSEKIFDSEIINKWAPVDFYNGGDHATAHMLYARFITRFFTKIGLMNNPEPFKHFLFNGKVTASDGSAFSKSRGNGVDPLEIINQGYGADALRMYLMFAAPLELGARWDSQGVPGTHRFLTRLWNLVQEFNETGVGEIDNSVGKSIGYSTHSMIKKVTKDIEESRYNTAIAGAMTQLNELYKHKKTSFSKNDTWKEALEATIACIAPFAPHAAEELWHHLGHTKSVHADSWPVHDEAMLIEDTVTLAVQVNGKVRAEIEVEASAANTTIESLALSNQRIKELLGNKKPTRIIVVPGRLVNIVV